MRKMIEATLVVEGKTDAAYLATFIEAEVVITNGSDVPRETIDYLTTLSEIKPIVVLTDPDGPGQLIRHKLNQAIPNLRHAYIPKDMAIRQNRVGVAYAPKDIINEALEQAIQHSPLTRGNLTVNDLFKLGLVGRRDAADKREIIALAFHLGHGNGKQLLLRLNSMNLGIADIAGALANHE